MEKTLLLIKPDGIKRQLQDKITEYILTLPCYLIAWARVTLSDAAIDALYVEHKDQEWFATYRKFLKSSAVEVFVFEGKKAVSLVRDLVGATDPKEAESFTIRSMWGESREENTVHSSASPEAAEREIKLLFPYL